MNIKIEKVENNDDEVLTFLAFEFIKLFMETNPKISKKYNDKQKEIVFNTFVDEFKGAQASKNATVYAAYVNNEVIGAVQLDSDNYLSNLFVKEEYRNQLIGTNLLKRVINECSNFDIIRVDASIKAVSLYQRFSFQKAGTFNGRSIPMELERSQYEKRINFSN